MLNFNFLQFREILEILPNTVIEAATSFDSERPQIGKRHYLILLVTKTPKWFTFNHHQSVGNPVSFLVGPKFSNLVVCIAFPSEDVGYGLQFDIFINGKRQFPKYMWGANDNYDHVWLIYGKVNISNPSEENRIEVEERCSTQWETTLHSEVQQENLGKSTRVLPSLIAYLQNPEQLHNPCWTPPPYDWIKVKYDAAPATSSTTIAVVARNSTGMVVTVNSHGCSKCFP
nr:hypothetical protein CFP56_56396 [Quercus suber]